MQLIFTIGQILFGGFFLYNGIKHFTGITGNAGYAASKNVPMPKLAVAFTGIMLVLGGLGIILDLMTGYALSLVIIFLLVTSFMMHDFWKVTDPMQKQMQVIQFTKNMALAGAAMMLLAFTWF